MLPIAFNAMLGGVEFLRVLQHRREEGARVFRFPYVVDDAERDLASSNEKVRPVTINSIARTCRPGARAAACHPCPAGRRGSLPAARSCRRPCARSHVGRHRDLEAAADVVPVDRGDHELRRLLEAVSVSFAWRQK